MEREFIPIPTMKSSKANSRMTRWNPLELFICRMSPPTPSNLKMGCRQVRACSSFQTDENSSENSRMSFRPNNNQPSSQPKTRCLKKTKTGVNSIRWFSSIFKKSGNLGPLKTFLQIQKILQIFLIQIPSPSRRHTRINMTPVISIPTMHKSKRPVRWNHSILNF